MEDPKPRSSAHTSEGWRICGRLFWILHRNSPNEFFTLQKGWRIGVGDLDSLISNLHQHHLTPILISQFKSFSETLTLHMLH